jgi:tetratricopeptide (TPR) repeat protein
MRELTNSKRRSANYWVLSFCLVIAAMNICALLKDAREAEKLLALATSIESGRSVDEREFASAYGRFLLTISISAKIDIRQSELDAFAKNMFAPRSGDAEGLRSLSLAIDNALASNEQDPALWNNGGWTAALLGQQRKAFHYLQRAVETGKDDYTYYVSLGLFYEHAAELHSAASAYASALYLNPRLAMSEFFSDLNRRNAEVARDSFDNAVEQLKRDYRVDHSPLVSGKISRLLLENGKVADSGSYAADTIKRLPNLSGAWVTLGEYYLKRNDFTDAATSFANGSYLDSNDSIPLQRLGMIYLVNNRYDEALRYLTAAAISSRRRPTEHAKRMSLIYGTPVVISNDIFPSSLLPYTAPKPEYSSICQLIAIVERRTGNLAAARGWDQCGQAAER